MNSYLENLFKKSSGIEYFPVRRFTLDSSDLKIVISDTVSPIHSERPSSSKSSVWNKAFASYKYPNNDYSIISVYLSSKIWYFLHIWSIIFLRTLTCHSIWRTVFSTDPSPIWWKNRWSATMVISQVRRWIGLVLPFLLSLLLVADRFVFSPSESFLWLIDSLIWNLILLSF